MATGMIFNNARVLISTATCNEPLLASSGMYDVSAFMQQVRINLDAELRDNTVMGMSYRSQIPALRSATIEGRALQQFSIVAEPVTMGTTGTARSIHGLLFDLYSSASKFIVAVKPDGAATRTSCNPEMWMPASLQTHVPVDGAVADLLVSAVRFNSQGNFVNTVSSS